MNDVAKRPAPNPLPVTVQDLEAMRKVFHQPTLNDRVDAIFVQLWPDENFRRLLDAVSDEDAVEGSISLDQGFAALMVRTRAKENGDNYVAGKKLATIGKALNVVMKRLSIGRRQRAHEVAGHIVDMSNNGAAE